MVNTLIDPACGYLEINTLIIEGYKAEDRIYCWSVRAITKDGLHVIMANFSKKELAQRFHQSVSDLLQRIKTKGN